MESATGGSQARRGGRKGSIHAARRWRGKGSPQREAGEGARGVSQPSLAHVWSFSPDPTRSTEETGGVAEGARGATDGRISRGGMAFFSGSSAANEGSWRAIEGARGTTGEEARGAADESRGASAEGSSRGGRRREEGDNIGD